MTTKYHFKPQDDITPGELAILLQILLRDAYFTNHLVDLIGDESYAILRRHFEEESDDQPEEEPFPEA